VKSPCPIRIWSQAQVRWVCCLCHGTRLPISKGPSFSLFFSLCYTVWVYVQPNPAGLSATGFLGKLNWQALCCRFNGPLCTIGYARTTSHRWIKPNSQSKRYTRRYHMEFWPLIDSIRVPLLFRRSCWRAPPFFRLDLGWWAFELRTPTNSSSKSDTSEASSIRSSSERPLALTGGNFNLAIFYSQPSEFKCLIINCILFMTFRISRSKSCL